MKRVYTIFLIVAVLLPLSFFAHAADGHDGIVAMSYNIRNGDSSDGTNSWQYRYAATALMIDDQKPDVIGIQEALYDSQVDYLLYSFDKQYKLLGSGSEDGKKKGEICAIMYNVKTLSPVKSGTFWLSDTPDKPSLGWDAESNRTVTWAIFKDKASGRRFLFINTRIAAEGEQARTNGIALILNKIQELNPDGYPVIFAADLNVEPSSKDLAPLKSALSDARESAVISDEEPSFNGWGKAKKTIDYIWYKGLSCTRFETVTKGYYERNFISDHYPVKGTFVF